MTSLKLLALTLFVSFSGLATLPAAANETVYYGSAKSNKYHSASCQWAKKTSSENLVTFKAKDEAAAKGYQPCKVCKP